MDNLTLPLRFFRFILANLFLVTGLPLVVIAQEEESAPGSSLPSIPSSSSVIGDSAAVAPTPETETTAPESDSESPAAADEPGAGEAVVTSIEQLRRSVVRLTVTSQDPDYTQPWNPGGISRGTGSGFVISGNRIVTNAHNIANARVIAVEKEGDARPYEATVKFAAHDCDLAMIEVKDESFFEGMVPLELGGVPSLDSVVSVFGYPIGGDRLSITRGVVSRIDFRLYVHPANQLHLAIQIDAAINAGNSGGPVLQDGRVVGVAFQGIRGDVAQNVGYMIPMPVVRRFLEDVEDGAYDGYVDLAVSYFDLVNPAHRKALGLDGGDQGVVVTSVWKAGQSYGHLKEGDVLMEIDGHTIFSNGSVEIDGERVNLAEIVERKYYGDKVTLKVLRDGVETEVVIHPGGIWPANLSGKRYGVQPRYVVFCGLVFQPLTYDFMSEFEINDPNILHHFAYFMEDEIYLERPEIVVLSNILEDPVNTYMAGFAPGLVEEINGKKIRVLEDVAAAFNIDTEYHVIRLEGNGRPLVLRSDKAAEAHERILKNYNVTKDQHLGPSYVPETVIAELTADDNADPEAVVIEKASESEQSDENPEGATKEG